MTDAKDPRALIQRAKEAIALAESSRVLVGLPEAFEQALARAEKAERALTWQLIETAPQDGTSILGWCGDIRDGGYGIRHLYWDSGWLLVGGDLDSDYAPTHWMPLPDAPKETT